MSFLYYLAFIDEGDIEKADFLIAITDEETI